MTTSTTGSARPPGRGSSRRGPGRRPGTPDTRGEIVAAARRVFAERGYDAATLRGIAREAGVDPALVHHYFDGKEQLFLQAMDLPVDPDVMYPQVVAGGLDGMGERLVRTFLAVWEAPENRARLVAMLRAMTANDVAAELVRDGISRILFDRLTHVLDRPDARLRIAAVASQLIGMAFARYVVGFEPLASADVEDLVRLLAPTLQRYLAGDL